MFHWLQFWVILVVFDDLAVVVVVVDTVVVVVDTVAVVASWLQQRGASSDLHLSLVSVPARCIEIRRQCLGLPFDPWPLWARSKQGANIKVIKAGFIPV